MASVFGHTEVQVAVPSAKELKSAIWLNYWHNAHMVNLDAINSIHDMHLARKFCSCMRVGIFASDVISDLDLWRGLLFLRQHPDQVIDR